MNLLCKSLLLTMVVGAAAIAALFTWCILLMAPPLDAIELSVAVTALALLLVAAFLLRRLDEDSPTSHVLRTFIVGVLAAVVGYVIVAAIGIQYWKLHRPPTNALLWAAPVTLFWATEGDPPWAFLLTVIAPLNAVLYSGIAIAIATVAQRLSSRSATAHGASPTP